MIRSLFALMLVAACGHHSPSQSSQSSDPPAGSGSAVEQAGSAAQCPPPKETGMMCAAVMTYVKNPANGACCAYPSPCTVALEGQQYSDEGCAMPMGPASP